MALWFAVAGDIDKGGRFIVGHIEHDVLLPVALAAFWIFVPGRDFSGKTEDQNVVPPVLVEVVGEGEEIVRVSVVGAEGAFESFDGRLLAVRVLFLERLRGGIVFVAFLEVRSLIPIRARDDVHFGVVIEVAEIRAFAPELVAELDLFE